MIGFRHGLRAGAAGGAESIEMIGFRHGLRAGAAGGAESVAVIEL